MSTLNQHLVRRGAIYHFRRRLSSPLKEILSRSHFDGSLQTADPARARRLARQVSVALDQLAERLQRMPPARRPTPGQLNLVLKELFDSILRDGDRRRALPDIRELPLTVGDLEMIDEGEGNEYTESVLQYYKDVGAFDPHYTPREVALNWHSYAENSLVHEVHPLLSAALTACEVSLDVRDAENYDLCKDATNVAAEAYKVDSERWAGNRGHHQHAPGWIDDKYPVAPALLQVWSGKLNAQEVNFLARSIEDVATEYWKSSDNKDRAPKTLRDWELAVHYFVDLSGKERIGDISEQDVREFRTLLNQVPREYGKGVYFDITPREAIKKRKEIDERLKEAKNVGKDVLRFEGRKWSLQEAERKTETMSLKTANKHLSFFTKMWTSSIVPRPLQAMSPFKGALYPKSRVRAAKIRKPRSEYNVEDLIDLFGSPVWTGCESASRRSTAGRLIIPDARFWCPLIAAFTGMRREEICQLKATDFTDHSGIWYVKIQATEGRRLKTFASERDIPIPDELIKIGLRDFRDYRRPGWLFPELAVSSKNGTRGDGLGKWFHRYRCSIGLDRPGLDFHSFRKTFTQYLRRAGVPLDHIKPITGHQENDITLRHYAPAFSLEQKKKVIEEFDLGVSFPQLYGRMPELLANLEAPPKRKLARRSEPGGSPIDEAAAAE